MPQADWSDPQQQEHYDKNKELLLTTCDFEIDIDGKPVFPNMVENQVVGVRYQ